MRTPLMSLLMREMMAPVGLSRKYPRCRRVRWASRRFFSSNSTFRPGTKNNSRETVRVTMIASANNPINQMRLRKARPAGSEFCSRISIASCR